MVHRRIDMEETELTVTGVTLTTLHDGTVKTRYISWQELELLIKRAYCAGIKFDGIEIRLTGE